jgi:RND family efflux transporter MFP subunit
MNPQKKKLYLIIGIPIIAALIWWIIKPSAEAEVGRVIRGDAVSAVYGTIHVEPVRQNIIRSQLDGSIKQVSVIPGQMVKQGEVLAEVRDDKLDHELKKAQAEYDVAFQQSTIGSTSQYDLKSQRNEVEQLKRLYDEGNISKMEYDRAQNKLAELDKKMKQEQLSIDQQLTMQKQNLDRVQTQMKQGMIVAPIDGVILEVYAQVGESVQAQAQLFKIGSKECQLRADINEEDVGSLKKGMKAMVKLYSFQDQDFSAKVTEILPQGDNQTYNVLLDIENKPENLMPGMTGELNIITGHRDNALIVPTRAIRGGTVLVVSPYGIVSERRIKTGFRSIERTEVIEGLEENELVVLSEQDRFLPNQRISKRIREEQN